MKKSFFTALRKPFIYRAKQQCSISVWTYKLARAFEYLTMRSCWNAGMTLNHLVKTLIHFIQGVHEQPVSQLRRYRTNVREKQFGKEPVYVISFRTNHFFVPIVFKRFVHIKGKIDYRCFLRNQHLKYF